MKVQLINPHNTIAKDSIKRLTTPLGLLYIASMLEQKGHDVDIIDSACEGYYNVIKNNGYVTYGLTKKELSSRILTFDPDVVGVTSMFSAHQNNVLEVCKWVKGVSNAVVVVGGLHPSIMVDETLRSKYIDFVIIGEGEYRFVKLLDCLSKKQKPVFDGIAYNGHTFPMVQRIDNLDDLPLPSRHLIDMKKYIEIGTPFAPFSKGDRVEQILTSRGCPFHCVFCSSVNFWGHKLRLRSVGNILSEIEQLIDVYNINELQFTDDNLTANGKRAKEFFKQMTQYNLSWCTPNGLMLKTVDNEMIDLMAKSGAYQFSFAFESGSRRVLKEIINKQVPDKKQCKKIIDRCHEHNIQIHGMFIVGFPGETKKEIMQTLDYPYDLDIDSASFFIASPLPGSRLYDECKKKGYLNKKLRTDFKTSEINIPKSSKDYVMSKHDLEQLVDDKTKEYNNYIRTNKKDAWDVKYKQFLTKHDECRSMIKGRVT